MRDGSDYRLLSIAASSVGFYSLPGCLDDVLLRDLVDHVALLLLEEPVKDLERNESVEVTLALLV